MKIYCCSCQQDVNARLTDGYEIYPHRTDLWNIPFWKCDTCKNFVGCHYKSKNRTHPLGVIPTLELKKLRQQIHQLIDPIWQQNFMSRKEVYARISESIGYEYHTAKIRTVEEAKSIVLLAMNLRQEVKL